MAFSGCNTTGGRVIQLADKLELDSASARRTADGYLVADAKSARTGIQLYTAAELGLTDRAPSAKVRVYRPPEAVFDTAALASMAHRPMTNDHPTERVTADNWKSLSVGQSGGDVVRDGDFVRIPLVMMDAAAIKDFEAGKRELSWGYTCELTLGDGVTPDGEAYDAVQSDIRANHIALCWKARGGQELVFGDQNGETEVATKIITFDGLPIEATDAAEAVIRKLEKTIADTATSVAALNTTIGELTATVATKDGEIAALTQQVKDGVVTPAKLSEMAAARLSLETAAKPLLGDGYAFAGKGDADIRRDAVVAKLGDSAKAMDDAAISGAFSVYAKAVTDAAADGGDDAIRQAVLGDGSGTITPDASKVVLDARAAMIAAQTTPTGAAKH